MGKRLLVMVVVFGSLFLIGCGKKQNPADESQEAISMEELSAVEAPAAPQAPEVKAVEVAPLPPQGPYKPSAQEIQKALKHAGFYTGEIDGKIGPVSEAAIREFQKANGLEADGKVGPKTWEALSKHLIDK